MSREEHVGHRDAIHVPFIVCKCHTPLQPGQKCSLRGDGDHITYVVWSPGDGANSYGDPPLDWHGVADPFRESPIEVGELFRLFIRKECFSNLTHQFQIEVGDRSGTVNCHSACDVF